MLKEFTTFLRQYGVIGLAIAVVIGGKLGDLVKAMVDGLLMPFIGALIPGGDWRNGGVGDSRAESRERARRARCQRGSDGAYAVSFSPARSRQGSRRAS